jgi:hypothetical protein
MSFASQIISSVNKADESVDSEKDIGFDTDIETQIKQSILPKRSDTSIEKQSMNSLSSNSNSQQSLHSGTKSIFSLFQGSMYTVIIALGLMVLLLHHNNIEIFGELGDLMDNIIKIAYKLFQNIYDFVRPFTENIEKILFGVTSTGAKTAALGSRELADMNSEVTYYLTSSLVDKDSIRKVDKKMINEVNKKSDKKNVVENDEIDSAIQKKSDWCYIGEDQGIRKCVEAGESKCMSGLKFASYEDCVGR